MIDAFSQLSTHASPYRLGTTQGPAAPQRKAIPHMENTNRGVSRRTFFGVGAAATGVALTGAAGSAFAAPSGDGFGPTDSPTDAVTAVPIVAGAQVMVKGYFDFAPLTAALSAGVGGVFNGANNLLGTMISLPAGSRIVRIDTLGNAIASSSQSFSIIKRNPLTSNVSTTVATFVTPTALGDLQASYTTEIAIAAGDLLAIEVDGTTNLTNRIATVTIQYFPPAPAATPGAAPAFNPIVPARVYDSRTGTPAPGALAPNGNRVISVATSLAGAAVVPTGATAVTYNVTATGTTGPNFLSVVPGDVTAVPGTSSLNWGGGYDIANSGTVKLDSSRQVKVFMGDQSGSTNFIIDITGYYL
jgi:hypothetical protein